jgi:2-phosphoglycerate kinase
MQFMIYLIGGAPRVGKSIAAKALAETIDATIVSTDNLIERVGGTLSEEEKARKFPWPEFFGDAFKNISTPQERVELQQICARSLESEIDRHIDETTRSMRSIIIEGVHLLPDHVNDLIRRYGADKMHSIFVGSNDMNCVLDGFERNTNPNDWLKNADADVRRQVAEYVVAQSERIKEMTIRVALPYIERTGNFQEDIKVILGNINF